MINDLFNNVNMLQKGLDASWLRNQVITNNIANVDTPGFKASSVEFESRFKQALAAQDGGFAAKTTRKEHYDFTGEPSGVTPAVVQDTSTSYRMDGNNVDIDYENVELAKNTIYYNELVQQVSSEFDRLNTAING